MELQSLRYGWVCTGGSAEKWVWLQLLQAEVLDDPAEPGGEGNLPILLDLVKCFEHVHREHVWRGGGV